MFSLGQERRLGMSSGDVESAPAPPFPEVLTKPTMDARFVGDVSPFIHLLERAARRYTRDSRDAEDLVQETLLKAYRGIRSFRQGSNMKAWLFQILKRTWIDEYRAARRRPSEVLTEQFSDSGFFGGRYPTHVSPSAETDLLDANLKELVHHAFRGLAEPLRLVVYYADVEGRSCSEIAGILNIPMGTVMSRRYRGRQWLRARLSDTGDAKR